MMNVIELAKLTNEFFTQEGGVDLNDESQQERLIKTLEEHKEEGD